MAKIIPISEHFQHFLAEMKESFWSDLYGHRADLSVTGSESLSSFERNGDLFIGRPAEGRAISTLSLTCPASGPTISAQ
jgi:hypothetical protein